MYTKKMVFVVLGMGEEPKKLGRKQQLIEQTFWNLMVPEEKKVGFMLYQRDKGLVKSSSSG